jgi:hypothetical protein
MKRNTKLPVVLASVGAQVSFFFTVIEFQPILKFFGLGDNIHAFWAGWLFMSLVVLFTLIWLAIIGIATAIYESVEEFREGRKRCPHGIRKANERQCAPCAGEKAAREKQFAEESAERERKKSLLAESKALRSEEIARLSKAWLAQSDAYFSMSPTEFEDAVARLFLEVGYDVKQTPYSNDGGKDAILWKDGRKYVLECKRYNREALTGRRDLQILIAAMHDEGADGAFFVSTGRFARTATAYAMENQITIYDGDHLPILVNSAFGEQHSATRAKVICESCGEIVTFDIFNSKNVRGICVNKHEVLCNIKPSDLKVAFTLETPVCPNHKIPMKTVNESWGEFWKCPASRCKERIPLRHRRSATKRADKRGYPEEVTPEEVEPEKEPNCITLVRSGMWNIWAPVFDGHDRSNMGWAVPCGQTTPDREEYRDLLYDYVDELVRFNPQEAREAVEYFNQPSLLHTSTMNEVAYTVSHCDGMNLVLNEIDWERDNPPRTLAGDEELPSLMEILEKIPTGLDLR